MAQIDHDRVAGGIGERERPFDVGRSREIVFAREPYDPCRRITDAAGNDAWRRRHHGHHFPWVNDRRTRFDASTA